MFAIALIT